MNPQEMSVVSSGEGRLHVRVTEEFKVSEASRLLEEVRRCAEAAGAKEVLIDLRDYTRKFTVIQRLQMAVAVVAKLRGFRMAAVFSENSFDPQRLGQTMANNRGGNVATFTDLAEAEAWLMAARRASEEANWAKPV